MRGWFNDLKREVRYSLRYALDCFESSKSMPTTTGQTLPNWMRLILFLLSLFYHLINYIAYSFREPFIDFKTRQIDEKKRKQAIAEIDNITKSITTEEEFNKMMSTVWIYRKFLWDGYYDHSKKSGVIFLDKYTSSDWYLNYTHEHMHMVLEKLEGPIASKGLDTAFGYGLYHIVGDSWVRTLHVSMIDLKRFYHGIVIG